MKKFNVDLADIRNEKDLAVLLGAPEPLIRQMLSDDDELFKKHSVKKRNGRGSREFLEIENEHLADALKAFADRLADYLEDNLIGFPHDCCQGYIKKRSIYTNAALHLRARVLVRADIHNFFPSINIGRITKLFRDLQVPNGTATLLARFLTYQNALPLGFCTSPIIANAVCYALDVSLNNLAERIGYRYSRYSDDLTFSGHGQPPSKIEIASEVAKHSFTLNQNKFRTKIRGQAFYVTGLSVSDPIRPRASRKFKKALRQELYYAKRFGLYEHLGRRGYASFESGINKIDGRISFLKGIEPILANELKSQWIDVLEIAKRDPVQLPRPDRAPRALSMFFDESLVETPTGKVFLLGCVVTQDTTVIRRQLEDIRASIIADQFTTGRKAVLKKKGLHWTDVSEDIKSLTIQSLALMPLRIYVTYRIITPDSPFKETYYQLLEAMLKPRLIALDGSDLSITFEQHSELKAKELEGVVTKVFTDLESKNSRRPLARPSVNVAGKLEEPCLSIVDFSLGILGQYAKSEDNTGQMEGNQPGDLATKRFERLRAKFRVIRSEITSRIFTRRRRFKPWRNGIPD